MLSVDGTLLSWCSFVRWMEGRMDEVFLLRGERKRKKKVDALK